MEIDELLRRCRFALSKADLPAQADSNFLFLADAPAGGERIMLDTCVILDQLQGRLPRDIEERIRARVIYHSPIVLGELAFLFGRLDPSDARTSDATREVRTLLAGIGTHRIFDLTHDDTMRGMVLAGCMARILGYNKQDRRKAQNDAILAAQASRLGCLVVTRNIRDFDRLGQLDERLKVAFYRKDQD
jgi:predicted nucleic acid-binding protein